MLIAQISDLHFGAASPLAVRALSDSLLNADPALTVVTGDLTQEGRRKEFEEAQVFLASLPGEVMVIPGNHDIPVRNLYARFVEPYARFSRYIDPEINPVRRSEKLHLVGVNSARRAAADINWSFGRLSREQIRHAANEFETAAPEAVKGLAVHHPFLKGSGTAGSRIVRRGPEMLGACALHGLDFTMTGHVHHSSAKLMDAGERSVIAIQAGTATSLRTRLEPPAFNLVSIKDDDLNVDVMTFDSDHFSKSECFSFERNGDAGWRAKNLDDTAA